MKKIVNLLIILFVLSGCAKAIPDKEAGNLFVDQVIYQKGSGKFRSEFQNGNELNEGFKENEANFQKNFTEGLLSAGGKVSQKEADEISQLLMDKVKDTTKYKLKKIGDAGNIRVMNYEIYGLNFVKVMKDTTKALVSKMMKEPEFAKDQNKIIAETFVILKDNIGQAEAKEEPVEIALEMKPEKGKWTVVRGQREQISNMYLAFVAGVKDQKTLTEEMNKAMQEVTAEVQKELNK